PEKPPRRPRRPGPPRTPPPTLTSTRPAVRWFPVGATPRCEAEPRQNPEPAPIAPGAGAPTAQNVPWLTRRHGTLCRSTAPGAKADPSQNPQPPPQSHPGRVLLRFRARPADTPLRAYHVGAPPPLRKRS